MNLENEQVENCECIW